jgi:hypothetical protein
MACDREARFRELVAWVAVTDPQTPRGCPCRNAGRSSPA